MIIDNKEIWKEWIKIERWIQRERRIDRDAEYKERQSNFQKQEILINIQDGYMIQDMLDRK